MRVLICIVIISCLLLPICQAVENIQGDEILKIPLNTDKKNLLFELDNMDVTTLVRFIPNYALIQPIQSLSHGMHQVKLYRLSKGNLQFIKQYDFKILKKEKQYLSDIEIEGTVNTSSTLLTSEYDEGSENQKWAIDGTATVMNKWKGENWAMDAQTNLSFDKNNLHTIELEDYLVNLNQKRLSTQLGHHQMNSESLVLYDFHRRGLSINWTSEEQDKTFTGFAFNSDPIKGFRQGLGISNDKTRVIGSLLTSKPFENKQETELAVTWLIGKNKSEHEPLHNNKAWSLSAKSKYFANKLSLRGELGQSVTNQYDQQTQIKKMGNAYKFSVVYEPIPENLSSKDRSLKFSFNKHRISPSFYSLTNTGLSTDLDSINISSVYKKKELTLQTTLEQQRDNLDNYISQATVNSRIINTSIDYIASHKNNAYFNFLGTPHLNVNLLMAKQYTSYLPENVSKLNKQIQQIELLAEFSHQKWDWNVKLAYDKIEDKTNQIATNHNQAVELGWTKKLNDTDQFSIQWKINKQKSKGTDDITQQLAILNASMQLIPRKLLTTVNLTWNKQKQARQLNNQATALEFGLIWQTKPHKKLKKKIWLKGQYATQQTKTLINNDNKTSYQLMTGLTITF